MAKDFTLDDFRRQLDQFQKMDRKDLLGRMPDLSEMVPEEEDRDLALSHIRQMIDAMTDEERSKGSENNDKQIERVEWFPPAY
jgi:signal recognition particle subunit SRP54